MTSENIETPFSEYQYHQERLEIRDSGVHGRGVFARTFVLQDDVVISSGMLLFRYLKPINHSCEPNIYLNRRMQAIALKNIYQGEELFFDYRYTVDRLDSFECRCGSAKCCGHIGQQQLVNNSHYGRPCFENERDNFYLISKVLD